MFFFCLDQDSGVILSAYSSSSSSSSQLQNFGGCWKAVQQRFMDKIITTALLRKKGKKNSAPLERDTNLKKRKKEMGKASRWLKSLLGMKKDKQTPIPPTDQNDNEEKRRWSFAHSRNDSVPPPRRISLNIPAEGVGDAAWLRNYLSEKDDNQAIAVAAATAAAEVAVAAAQAAMVVVRLTNQGRFAGAGRERWAAVKIQTVFRGYLARKALKALKGLVKLQAYVRGYLVRKRAAATLHSMQALIRAQTARLLRPARPSSAKMPLETQSRISEERFDGSRSEFQSKRTMLDSCYDDTAKIVEIDTYKPRSIRPYAEYGDQVMYALHKSGPFGARFLTPARLSVPSRRYERGPCDTEDRQFPSRRRNSTAHCTPRFADWADGPFTSARPVRDDSQFRTYCQPHRNYMASTQSFEAKSRSQSTPKQRVVPQPSPSKKKMMPLEKVMKCRHSLSGVRMNRSYSEDRGGALHF